MDGQNDARDLAWIVAFFHLLPVAAILQLMSTMVELFGDEGPIDHIAGHGGALVGRGADAMV